MIKTIGRYQILEKIGQGGMGTVYKAFDPLLERAVAVKVIATQFEGNPHLRERFFREARAAGHLAHRNIIVIHDLGEQEGQPFLAMEFLEGTNLDARIRSVGRLRLERALHVIAEVCEGLEYAHGHGVFHRDIKPANIFLTDSGQVKVLDFGLARLVSSELTRSNTMIGTVNYMAPEQIRGEKVDHRGDVFSVGVVLYELLTGKKAFDGDSFATTIFKILQETPEPPQRTDPSIPSAVSEILDRAIAKARDERYQTIGQMLRDLALCREALKGSDPTAAIPPGVGPRPPSDPARRIDSPAPIVTAAGPGTPVPDSDPPAGAASSADTAARRIFVGLIIGAAVVTLLAFWTARREPPAASRSSQTTSAPADAPAIPVPEAPTQSPTEPPQSPRRASDEPTATEGTTARESRPAPAARPTPRPGRAVRDASPTPIPPQALPPPPAAAQPPPQQQNADDALAQMSRSKAAAEAAGAESLAPAFYNAASASEREGRERQSQAQYGEAAARFYEAAGLFRSAEIAARTERAARDEQTRRVDEAAKAQARQSEARPAPQPRAEEPASPSPEHLVREVIARYKGALEARSIEELRKLWPTMTAAQQRAIRSDFENARTIRLEVVNPHVEIGTDTARVTALRRYELLTTDGRRLQTDTRMTIVLRRIGGVWLIDDIQHQAAR